MSRVDLVREAYEAWNRDDFEGFLDYAAPDIEFRPNAGFADLDQVYRGHEGVRAWYRDWRNAWETVSQRVERIEDLGDHVLALVVVTGQGRGSGVVVEDRRAHVLTVQEGLCTRFESFGTRADALEAVGLRE